MKNLNESTRQHVLCPETTEGSLPRVSHIFQSTCQIAKSNEIPFTNLIFKLKRFLKQSVRMANRQKL